VDKQLNLALAGQGKGRSVSGQEKFTFLYVAFSCFALTGAIVYSMLAGLTRLQSLFLLVGSVLVACAAVFFSLEVRRMARGARGVEAVKAEADIYASRSVPVNPPSGEPYPHHEQFVESAGFDQGQLTSRIPGETPFLESFFSRRSRKPKA